MRKFSLLSLTFFAGLVGLYALYYTVKTYQTRLAESDIYVWGDSRMYWGLNNEYLETLSGKKVCPTQQEGASVYDLLTFVNRVPNNSTCIVGLSECVLFRQHASDYNRSGMNIWAIGQLLISGYSIKDVYGIAKLNKWQPINITTQCHDYFEQTDTIVFPETVKRGANMYYDFFPYYDAKTRCYCIAIESLYKKNCQVILLDFAGYKDVELYAQDSPNRLKSAHFIKTICEKYIMPKDTIVLPSNQFLFYDSSHLNYLGAKFVTEKVADNLCGNKYIRIHSCFSE